MLLVRRVWHSVSSAKGGNSDEEMAVEQKMIDTSRETEREKSECETDDHRANHKKSFNHLTAPEQ